MTQAMRIARLQVFLEQSREHAAKRRAANRDGLACGQLQGLVTSRLLGRSLTEFIDGDGPRNLAREHTWGSTPCRRPM